MSKQQWDGHRALGSLVARGSKEAVGEPSSDSRTQGHGERGQSRQHYLVRLGHLAVSQGLQLCGGRRCQDAVAKTHGSVVTAACGLVGTGR